MVMIMMVVIIMVMMVMIIMVMIMVMIIMVVMVIIVVIIIMMLMMNISRFLSLPSIATEVRFLLTVSSCRHHFLPSEFVLLIIGFECGVCIAELASLFGKGFFLFMTNRDSAEVDVSGGSTASIRKISSSSSKG